MNKRDAKAESITGKYSIGQLREMIATARPRGGMSRVNPALALDMACDIYERAIADRDPGEQPAGMTYSAYKDRSVPSRDSLIIYNILRDCAP